MAKKKKLTAPSMTRESAGLLREIDRLKAKVEKLKNTIKKMEREHKARWWF